MKTVKRYALSKETWDEQSAARRFNPATVVTWNQNRKEHFMTLGAGDSDHLHFFAEDELFIALSVNYQLGYVGIEIYDTKHGNIVWEVFFDNNLEAVFGRNWQAKSPMYLTKTLMQYGY